MAAGAARIRSSSRPAIRVGLQLSAGDGLRASRMSGNDYVLLEGESGVDLQLGAGDVAGFVGGEED